MYEKMEGATFIEKMLVTIVVGLTAFMLFFPPVVLLFTHFWLFLLWVLVILTMVFSSVVVGPILEKYGLGEDRKKKAEEKEKRDAIEEKQVIELKEYCERLQRSGLPHINEVTERMPKAESDPEDDII